MNKENDEKFKAAKRAIEDLHGDTSVPRQKTKEQLEELFADIEGMLDGLDDDDEDG